MSALNEAIDSGTQAWWVEAKRSAPREDNRKGSKVPEITKRVAEYIQANAPVRIPEVSRAMGLPKKSVHTQMTTLTYIIKVYEDDDGVLHIL